MDMKYMLAVVALTAFHLPANCIKVDFGTRKGPIIPPTSTIRTPVIEPRSGYSPAPVYEPNENDIPNPTPYRPLLPYQYRSKVLPAYRKIPASIYYGTEYDRKYNPHFEHNYETLRLFTKYAEEQKRIAAKYRKGKAASVVRRSDDPYTGQPAIISQPAVQYIAPQNVNSPHYTGPQTFGPEHNEPIRPRYTVQYFGNFAQRNNDAKSVPQFGVLYSAGVKYYVPRAYDQSENDYENSVYDPHDVKYGNRQ